MLLRMTTMSERQSASRREVNRERCMLLKSKVRMAMLVPATPMMTNTMVNIPEMLDMMLSYSSDFLCDTPQVDSIFSSIAVMNWYLKCKYQRQLTYYMIKVTLIVINAGVVLIINCLIIVVEVAETCLCNHAFSHTTDSYMVKSEVSQILYILHRESNRGWQQATGCGNCLLFVKCDHRAIISIFQNIECLVSYKMYFWLNFVAKETALEKQSLCLQLA